MTAKEFLNGKTLTAIETVENLILNLVIEESVYGLDIDTKTIKSGTKLTRTNDFTISGNTLTSGNLTLNLDTTNMLSFKNQRKLN